jgi:hypothetical protein
MLTSFKNLKEIVNPFAEKSVEVEITSTCAVAGEQVKAGDRITVKESVARDLIAAGRAIDHAAVLKEQTRRQRLKSLIPLLEEPAPMPEDWSRLPKCFSLFWKLNQAGMVLIHHRDEIERRLIKRVSRKQMGSFSGINQISESNQSKIFAGLALSMDGMDAREIEELQTLKNAYQNAYEEVKEWQRENTPELIRHQMACSDAVQDTHGEVCRSIRDLHAMALELFKTRIAALGLGQHDVNRLFLNSADAVKYASIQRPTLQDLRLAWNDGQGDLKTYVDHPPATLANLLKGFRITQAEVEKLAKEATAELTRATKAKAA